MAKTIDPVDLATDDLNTLIATVNTIADTVNNEVLTANSNANGAFVTGNSQLFGYFTANTLSAWNEIRGGNNQTAATLVISSNASMNSSMKLSVGSATVNLVINSVSLAISNSTVALSITKPTAAQVADGGYRFNANGSWSLGDGVETTTTTTGTTAQEIDNFLKATYRSGKFVISIKDNAANGYQISEALAIHDDSATDAYITEYGTVSTDSDLGILSANANTTHVILYITPTSANTTVKSRKSLIGI